MTITSSLPFYYKELDVKLKPDYFEDYIYFLEKNLVGPRRELVEYILRTTYEEKPILVLKLRDERGNPILELIVYADEKPKVWVIPLHPKFSKERAEEVARRVELATLYYLEGKEEAKACFILLEKMKFAPEKIKEARRKVIEKLFFGTMFPLFALSLLFAYILFVLLGVYVLIAMPLSQLLLLVFSDKIVEMMCDWKITSSNRHVYLVCYTMPRTEYQYFLRKYYPLRIEIKKRLYEISLGRGIEITPELAIEVFTEYGMRVDEFHKVSVKKIDVYGIISRVFSLLDLPLPRIAILNTVIPNAAATGISPDVALVAITTGLLMKLDEEEIESVIAHEASHIKNHDPLMMFALSTGEYLLRLFVFFTFIYIMINPLIDFLYLFVAFTVLFFIAKFFEARADLEAVFAIGKPRVLARALKKIALRRLIIEKYPRPSFESWLSWDAHPPVSWRILRLEREEFTLSEHPFLASIKDCILGLMSTLGL